MDTINSWVFCHGDQSLVTFVIILCLLLGAIMKKTFVDLSP